MYRLAYYKVCRPLLKIQIQTPMFLPYLSSLYPFSFSKNLFLSLTEPPAYRAAPQKETIATKSNSKSVKQDGETVVACKCCGWKGKDAEAKSDVLYVENVTELELFCPQCNSYIGFL